MWAGGSLEFDNKSINQLATDNQRACCTEYISDVSVKGSEGEEKVFVTIKRQIGNLWKTTYPSTTHYKTPSDLEMDYLEGATRGEDVSQWAMAEKRNLVFMRQKSAAAAKEDAARHGKILKRMLVSRVQSITFPSTF
jgi:hydroxyacyl-ACP dehydratase HTD2-like protein with hotdog domain